MTLNFHERRSHKTLRESKAGAVASLHEAVEILPRAIPEIEVGTIAREVDDLML